MANDVECPYCGVGQEIIHDDGYGYSEENMHHQECGACSKTFGYLTSISFYYEAKALPCLNGEPHNFVPTFTVPIEYTKMECECGECRRPTPDQLQQITAERRSRYACREAQP
jgi:hypothetical protein